MIEVHAGLLIVGACAIFAVAWLGASCLAAAEIRRSKSDRPPNQPIPNAIPAAKAELDETLSVLQRVAARVDVHEQAIGRLHAAVGEIIRHHNALRGDHDALSRWVHAIPQTRTVTPPIGTVIGNHAPPAVDTAKHAADLQAERDRLIAEEEKRLNTYSG